MVWVVLPVKGFDKSKQRLAQVLNDDQRKRLAQAMLQDVLQAVSDTECIDTILVVTGNADIARFSYHYNAQVLMEPANCSGLNHAVDLGVKHAHFHGARKVLVLHADIPLVNSVDLMHIVHNHIDGGATLVPDKHEQGTNGLMLELPINLQFQYGEGSYHKHLQLLRQKGLVCDIAELPDLTLDIDSPEDLLELSLRLIDKPVSATSECLRAADMQQALMDIRRTV